ncbi:MAG: hypothetical protein JW995_03625 [Melioribacteraceae bacterium]|nr:hypothetical protein [Melioribacteraceae bacterium]
MTKSPWGAVLRSAVIPGWGQFYNESYWKIPVIWGLLGYYISVWIDQNQLYDKYKELYSNSIESGITISLYKRNRDFYKDQRDRFAVYIGLAYFLTMVDAYVDAHLFDFDVSVDLLIGQPQLKIKFPIR